MKITFITGHLCKERHALLNELALDLGECGAEVTVLTGFPSRRISNDVRRYYLEHSAEQISDHVTVYRIGSRKGEGNGLLGRMLRYLLLMRKLQKTAQNTPTDAYYIYSSPPFLGYMGKKLTKVAPVLYNAQDLFPDTLVHMKYISESNPLICFFRWKERSVYGDCSRIVTISEEMKKTIAGSGCSDGKIDVIYNWADVENLHHVEKTDNALMDELHIDKNRFTVSYAGDIGLFQGWDVILDSAKILSAKNFDIQYVIIGSGSDKAHVEMRIAEEGISNVQMLPLQPASRLSEIYSVGDVELVPIEKGITKMALPSKTGVIMATGSPILALVDNGSDIERIINGQHLGVVLEHGSAEKIADAVVYCYQHKNELVTWGHNAREFAKTNYSRKIQTRKYYEVLCKMTNQADTSESTVKGCADR